MSMDAGRIERDVHSFDIKVFVCTSHAIARTATAITNAHGAAQGGSCDSVGGLEARGITGSMTLGSRSVTSMIMEKASLSRTCILGGVLFLMLGAASCENGTDAQQKPAASALVPTPVEVLPAQPPRLSDQPMLLPPSLSPSFAAAASSTATGASSAAVSPATATANPKATGETPGIRQDPQTPGPMAPRTPKPAETM